VQHEHAASQNKALFASNNHGAPAVAATARPGEFSGRGVVAAKAAGAPYRAPAVSPREARAATPAESRGNNNAARPFTPPSHPATAPRAENGGSHPENAAKAKPSKPAKPPKPAKEEKGEKER
jgi:hypothetical protein